MDAEEILDYLLVFFVPGIPGFLLWLFCSQRLSGSDWLGLLCQQFLI